jgi:hypothetical protein
MAMKKRTYECLICGWYGTNPIDAEVMTPGDEGIYKVCHECYDNKTIPTEALILNLEIYSIEE